MAIYKPSIPIQLPFGRTEEDFIDIFSNIDTAVNSGDISKIVELSKTLYDYNALAEDPLLPTQTNAAIANIKYVEAAKRKAAENYKAKTGKDFIPKSEEEVIVDEKELNKFFSVDNQIADTAVKTIGRILGGGITTGALVDSINTNKPNDFAGYRQSKSNTFNAEPTFYEKDGKYFRVTKWDKEGNAIEGEEKEYTAAEKALVQAEWVKKQNLSQDTEGRWGVRDKEGNFTPTEISEDTAKGATTASEAGVTDPTSVLESGIYPPELQAALGAVGANIDATAAASVEDTLNTIAPKLRSFAANNGVTISDEQLNEYAKSIAEGTKTLEGVANMFREAFVIPQYKAFEKQIREGFDIKDLASPYITAMANTLELNPAEINLNDPLISKALSGVDDKGQASYMPLWQFNQNLRQDERYNFTEEANKNAISIANAFGQMFGAV